ncbi:MAG: 50S ribosomal protein L18 [Acidobacteriota bacterium]
MEKQVDKERKRRIIKFRIKKKVVGTAERPRLVVFKSLKHIYVQVVDDTRGRTITSASTLDKECRLRIKSGGNLEAARIVGEIIARRLKEKDMISVVFDRGGYLYHGRVKALAESARNSGLKF